MKKTIWVLGEALMDCVAQPDGNLRPLQGGSPFNMARAAARRGAEVGFLNPFSTDLFGQQLLDTLHADHVTPLGGKSNKPTSLAVVQIDRMGQPSYGFYREGIADRDYDLAAVCTLLQQQPAGILHTGSLMLLPTEAERTLQVIEAALQAGWTISLDVNMRPKLAPDLQAYVQAVRRIVPLAHWIKASDEDIELLQFGKAERSTAATTAQNLLDLAPQCSRLALTYGAAGAWLSVNGQSCEDDCPRIAVADSVGAGDTFWGNCLGDWALDDAAPAERAPTTLRNAMVAAAINCTRVGCQPPRFAEVENWGR
ncbi:hypothetical protein KIK84_01745 [Curvibacter sp. CHRR-16]|uniref:PfkB family carbohydrate kinase n=1 Tax=Curvibacter sp. CHRR-16 TaxID=2835872 RepID=UPI001BDA9F26|nr:PfkB family carbohydrate kinase [Curvibacter sp. CHRR-16]MBT0569039.1 hypothetical protein [Curvibacter sp. CHRR-16]